MQQAVSQSDGLNIAHDNRNKDGENMNKVSITQEKFHAKKPHTALPYSIKYIDSNSLARLQMSKK